MTRRAVVLLAMLLLPACRGYDYARRISDPDGFMPGDQFARYGREQAQAVAIARDLAAEGPGAAVAFARSQPDVTDVVADSQAHWLTLQFRSGWRTAVTPLDDGRKPSETPNLPAAGQGAPAAATP